MTHDQPTASPPPGFPFATAAATLLALFLFAVLVVVVYRSPNYLGGPTPEPVADPAEKLNEVKARNRAVLDGSDPTVKMSVEQAAAEVLAHAAKSKDDQNKQGRLPLPAEPKAAEKKP